LILPSPLVTISNWIGSERRFIKTTAEALCYNDPDGRDECEVFVKVNVPPLSYSLLKIQGDPLVGVTLVKKTGFEFVPPIVETVVEKEVETVVKKEVETVVEK
jgi:hypothetical protein